MNTNFINISIFFHYRQGILVGCGNPLLDISANVEEDLLQKYNLKPNDAILAEQKHMPLYKELIEKYKAEFIAGGSVQNSLRVCQWILQKPKIATFFGCVGSDDYAKILEENATKDGLNVRYQYNTEAATGTCAVLVTGTHRSLCANLAAANNFTLDHLQIPENKKLLDAAEYYYISVGIKTKMKGFRKFRIGESFSIGNFSQRNTG